MRLAWLGFGALAVAAACAVADEPILLDDAYDVPAGHTVELPVLVNDYLPARAIAEPFDAPSWVTAEDGVVTAAAPADWDGVATFAYRAGGATAEVTLRSVRVRARLEPAAEAVAAGAEHRLAAVVERSVGGGPWQPLPGAQVALRVGPEDGVAGDRRCRTDAAGRCGVGLRRDEPGRAGVTVASLQGGDGITFEPRPAPAAELRWVAARIRLSGDVTVPAGEEAVVAASAEIHDGAGWAPAPGAVVTFAVEGAGPLPDYDPAPCRFAPCELEMVSEVPTTTTVDATAGLTVAGVDLTAAAAPARVAWVGAEIELRGDADVPVGTAVEVNVTVWAHDGTRRVPAAGARVELTVAGHPNSRTPRPATREGCRTGPGGTCSVSLQEDGPRTLVVAAAAPAVGVGGIDVAASPAPGADTSVTLAWWAPTVVLRAPAVAAAGGDATVSAAVTVDDGIAAGPASATVRFRADGAEVGARCRAGRTGACSVQAARRAPGRATLTATATVTRGGGTATDDGSTTVTWISASLVLRGGGTAVAGETLDVVATVTVDSGGDPEAAEGATVALSDGAECTTGAAGRCTVSFDPGAPGSRTVSATGVTVDGVRFPAAGTVDLRWVEAELELHVGYRSGPDDEQIAIVTVDARQHDGGGWAPATGLDVEVTSKLGARTCTTGAGGACEVSFGIPEPGAYAVGASAGFTVAGLPIPRTADGVVVGVGGTVELVRSGLEAIPVRGTSRTLTVVVRGVADEIRPQAGATVTFSGPGGVAFTPKAECTTVGNGRCAVDVTSAAAGTVELCTWASFELRGWPVRTAATCGEFTWSAGIIDEVVPPDPLR